MGRALPPAAGLVAEVARSFTHPMLMQAVVAFRAPAATMARSPLGAGCQRWRETALGTRTAQVRVGGASRALYATRKRKPPSVARERMVPSVASPMQEKLRGRSVAGSICASREKQELPVLARRAARKRIVSPVLPPALPGGGSAALESMKGRAQLALMGTVAVVTGVLLLTDKRYAPPPLVTAKRVPPWYCV